MRDELLNESLFLGLDHARTKITKWVDDYNLGSGSTLIAADATGRVCRGVELDPLYVDVIARRYEAASGKPVVHVETGETFAALTARREREVSGAR
jgi:DNA modification methylase